MGNEDSALRKFHLHATKGLLERIGNAIAVAPAAIKEEMVFIAVWTQFGQVRGVIKAGKSGPQVGHAVGILTVSTGHGSEGVGQDSRQAKKKLVYAPHLLIRVGGKPGLPRRGSFLQIPAD